MTPVKHAVGRFLDRNFPQALIRYNLLRHYRRYEPELWLVPALAGRDDRAVDIGGNAGIWCLQMARYARAVECFEPNPVCIAKLERVLPGRARLHRVALSDHPGEAELRFDPANTGVGTIEARNTLSDNAGVKTVEAVKVPTATLDSFAFRGVALIKIDVEGHEEAVLAGATETFARERPALICEIEERHNPGGLARIRTLFAALGYRAAALDGARLRPLEAIEAEGRVALASAQGINNFLFVDPKRFPRLADGLE